MVSVLTSTEPERPATDRRLAELKTLRESLVECAERRKIDREIAAIERKLGIASDPSAVAPVEVPAPVKILPLPLSRTRPVKPSRTSSAQILLDAAASLSAPFSVGDLVVAAWRASPERFGLPGHEQQYPHSHAVSSVLYGRRGLIATGKLRKVPGGLEAMK